MARSSIIIVRHSIRLDAGDGGAFIKANSGENGRPFDPPLAQPKGNLMAQAAGHRIAQIIEEHNLGPVAAVASSPLVRCIETSMAFLPLLPSGGSDLKIFPDNSLLEFLSEGWYRSWAVPGALGYPHWGGPPGCGASLNPDAHCLNPCICCVSKASRQCRLGGKDCQRLSHRCRSPCGSKQIASPGSGWRVQSKGIGA
mmetsp:Transcript_31570/g.49443  ORF Transcript_31570/g.49443 Transcript_31570/m.49443 type:complete len:198 (+) Transcript_31570:183-776(+)